MDGNGEGAPAAATGGTVDSFDIAQIMRAIPHRYPFLLVDRVLSVEPKQRIVALKNVTASEPHFTGHFPGNPVMPGVLIVESMAQTAGVLVVESLGPEARGKLVYFLSIDGAKFRRPVVPGVVLLDAVFALSGQRPAKLLRAKFPAPVRPGEEVEVFLEPRGGTRFAFTCRRGGAVVLTGEFEGSAPA